MSELSKSPKPLGAENALDLVGNKWVIRIIHGLMSGTRRYNELQRALPDVSQRMLTLTLRNLERDGLVERKVYPVVPPHTEYTLTPLGETLVGPLQQLCRWATTHFDEVEQSRRRYDSAK